MTALSIDDRDPRSPLRMALEEAMTTDGGGLGTYTVLAPQNDPFRIDTPARHRDGAWLAMTTRELGLGNRQIHLRGMHYMVIGRAKPDGKPYTNTDDDWLWLSSDAAKAARFLGYIPFDQIVDQRNAAPVVKTWKPPQPRSMVTAGVDVSIPDLDDFQPRMDVEDFRGVQPYKLVIFGEKSSLEAVLAPLADTYRADLYLPTGEISDTLLHQMASIGAADGRPMVVLCFSDCDPAGWQMPISIGRKLQAFRTLLFPDLDFRVLRVALNSEQVGAYGLPSTPLKASEKRGTAWKAAFGVEQTEIDALAALQPALLRQIAREALNHFFDRTLDQRVHAAREEWLAEAQAALDDELDDAERQRIRDEMMPKLALAQEAIDAVNDAMQIDVDYDSLPPIVVPEAVLDDDEPEPLIDSDWTFAEQCQALKASKAYIE